MAKGAVVLTAGILALAAPALARAYPWPIKPFDEQHAIRGALDDPRSDRSFHFGVDISAPDGTAVYAVAPGTAFRYPDAVAVKQEDGHEFAYWHIEAAVPEHSFVDKGDLLGYVKAPWEHVHFAEWDGHTYLNPLRPGALEPYTDDTTPTIAHIDIDDDPSGGLQATTDAYDTPPMAPPAPWEDARWAPEYIQWRILRDDKAVEDWQTAIDFSTWLKPDKFDEVYAPGTEQNGPDHAGRYVFWLFHGLQLPAGVYTLEVDAWDTRGNTGAGSTSFVVAQSANTVKTPSR